ncbi:hypothetical protein QBC37DRAFT_125254 [Rhypophila decipiens]|uniref:DUF4604 domain-containing protein n=1 Tax=Rhypophila decipiens TaxID=261697 RepID=A0AAN6YAE9_9PEZI|nr:hypothetical protein QBC37DRAFT_125254 [Rhypophila decipiens]
MSQKVTAKNLQYNSSLPPFLARLRGQEAESRAHGGPDPILASQRRIGKPRSASAEAEDEPLVVDERGEVVNLAAMNEDNDHTQEKAGEEGEGDKADKGTGEGPATEEKKDDLTKSKKKRKLGKVIGGRDEDDEDENERSDKAKLQTETTKKEVVETGTGKKEGGAGNKKKKAKKIKLSFGDDEEEG